MSLLDTLKADQLAARKSSDKIAAPLLTTLIGEASKVSDEDFKKGQTEITDEKVLRTITKFLKGAVETKGILEAEFTRVMGHPSTDGQTRPLSDEGRVFMEGIVPKMRAVDREIAILTAYQPQQMTRDELAAEIASFKAANADANVGGIMAHLKANFAGLYDGKMASELARG